MDQGNWAQPRLSCLSLGSSMFSLYAIYWHVTFSGIVCESLPLQDLLSNFLVVWVLSYIFSKRTLPSPKPRPISSHHVQRWFAACSFLGNSKGTQSNSNPEWTSLPDKLRSSGEFLREVVWARWPFTWWQKQVQHEKSKTPKRPWALSPLYFLPCNLAGFILRSLLWNGLLSLPCRSQWEQNVSAWHMLGWW